MKQLNKTKISFLMNIILGLSILFFNCDASENITKNSEYFYKVVLNESKLFLGGQIAHVIDNKNNTMYLFLSDSCDNKSAFSKKIKSGEYYQLVLEKITPPIILRSSVQNMNEFSLDTGNGRVLIWSNDTVMVPIYKAINICGTYIKN